MAKPKISREALPAWISIAIIFAAYVGEKACKRLTVWSSTSAIIQAIVITAAVLAVFLLLLKCKDYYTGLFASVLAFKILPPNMEMLTTKAFDASAVYFLVRKAALAIFLYLIYYFYQSFKKEQKGGDYVHVMGLAGLLLIFPFVNSLENAYAQYAFLKTGNYIYVYAIQAAAYVFCFAFMLFLSFRFRGKTAQLLCDYSLTVMIIRMARKATSVLILAHAGMHVSKAYFAWIGISAVLAVITVIVRKKTIIPLPAEE